MGRLTFAVQIAVVEQLALEHLPVHLLEVQESREIHLPARQVRLGTQENLRRVLPALEKIPYMIAPFSE